MVGGSETVNAVRKDMELIGVADVVTDYRIKTAVALGPDIYAWLSEKAPTAGCVGIRPGPSDAA